jgi:hypothetical protein
MADVEAHFANALEDKSREPGLTLFDALVLERIHQHGNQVAYGHAIGVSESTFWRWRTGEIDPLKEPLSKQQEALVEDLGLPLKELQALSKISLRETCQLMLTDPEQNN